MVTRSDRVKWVGDTVNWVTTKTHAKPANCSPEVYIIYIMRNLGAFETVA